VHNGWSTDRENLLAIAVRSSDLLGDLVNEERARLLRRDVGGHERERAARRRGRQGVHPNTPAPDDDPIAAANPVHGRGAGAVGCHHDRAVHLWILDRNPNAGDTNFAAQVRRRIETGRKHPVGLGNGGRDVRVVEPVDPMDLKSFQ